MIIAIAVVFLLMHHDATAAPAAGADSVTVAAIFSLTGQARASNLPSVVGIRNAAAMINAEGGILGKPLDLVLLDNQSTPIGSSVAAEKAAEMGAVAIIGANWSAHSMAIARVAQNAGIPMITNISTHPDVTRTGDCIFRVCFTDHQQGRVMGRFAADRLKAKRAVVLVNLNSNYSILLAREFSRHFTKAGGRVSQQLEYKDNSTPAFLRNLVTRCRPSDPDVVFIPGYLESAVIINEMSARNMRAIPLGGDGWEADGFFEMLNTSVSEPYFCTHWANGSTSPQLAKYLMHRSNKSRIWSAEILAVDALTLLAHAMERAETVSDRARIRKALAATRGFQGISGTISFDQNGDPLKDVVIMTVHQGKAQFHSRFSHMAE